jgi:predicted transcriptional regulator
MIDTHRGRSKDGNKTLTIRLTQDEWAKLKELAEQELRSASGQAVWIIKQRLSREREQ